MLKTKIIPGVKPKVVSSAHHAHDQIIRNLSASEFAVLLGEQEIQKTLKRGWHAVKDLHLTTGNRTYWRWYVVYFAAKGIMCEASTLRVRKHCHSEASQLAEQLNRAYAFPEFAS